jgi:hypothetical protein
MVVWYFFYCDNLTLRGLFFGEMPFLIDKNKYQFIFYKKRQTKKMDYFGSMQN